MMSKVGQMIAQAREQAGHSQTTLARALGVTQSQLSLLELGHRRLRADHLDALTEALGQDEDWRRQLERVWMDERLPLLNSPHQRHYRYTTTRADHDPPLD
jgi:transcriptional regulator with XRE-family HTH domain